MKTTGSTQNPINNPEYFSTASGFYPTANIQPNDDEKQESEFRKPKRKRLKKEKTLEYAWNRNE